MAISTSSAHFLFGTATAANIAAAAATASTIVTAADNSIFASVMIMVSGSGTVVTSDTTDVYLRQGLGDIDGSGTDDLASNDDVHSIFLTRLKPIVTNPAIAKISIPADAKVNQLRFVNNASANSVDVRAFFFQKVG